MSVARLLAVLFIGIQLASFGQTKHSLYNQVGRLTGHIFIANHPQLGRTPDALGYFVLQRADCARCLIGVHTDIDGKYTVSLGVGKYRVFCDEGQYGEVDMIRKGQPREVTVRTRPNDTEFNIDLELPPEWQK
jgi:hypothetical protein